MPGSVKPPEGIAGACFEALAELGGAATTTQIRLHLNGQYRTSQVRGALHGLAGRKPPLAEVARRGAAGYGNPDNWRLTPCGATLTRGYPVAAGRNVVKRCGPAAGHALSGRRAELAETVAGLDDGELMYLILAAGRLKIAAETELGRRPRR